MGEMIGAEVELKNAPLKYAGLTPTEIWISEAQERMVMAVPTENVESLAKICDAHGVEWCDLGFFGTPNRELILKYDATEVGRISMAFMHDGVPMSVRKAVWDPAFSASEAGQTTPEVASAQAAADDIEATTLALLSHPNIASKAWIIRQYDHEVQGGSVIKPFAGEQAGPSDAAVIRPNLSSSKGLAIGNGLATGLARDPYVMGLAAIDECVRNLVCVGADPSQIAILDNFCWPSCADERTLGSLVRAAEACLDGGLAYRTPFVSGKDSLSNQFQTDDGRTIRVPPTLLISGIGIVPDEMLARTMDLKRAGNALILVGTTTAALGGSHVVRLGSAPDGPLPMVDLAAGPANARAVHSLFLEGLVVSAHDLSEGGVLVAAAEMAFAGDLGATIDLGAMHVEGNVDCTARAFAETPSRYLLEVTENDLEKIGSLLGNVGWSVIGSVNDSSELAVYNGESMLASMALEDLSAAWSEAIQA
jgi:phosphoribosylformylglycinamidine synthase